MAITWLGQFGRFWPSISCPGAVKEIERVSVLRYRQRYCEVTWAQLASD